MQVAEIVYGTSVDGPGLRTSIYFAGCKHKCPFCHNKQLWPFDAGKQMSVDEILEYIKNRPFSDITFTGGDPLFQVEELVELAKQIKETSSDITIWCYTGFKFEDVFEDLFMSKILDYIDVLVDGPFLKALYDKDLVFRGSSNQRLIDVKSTLGKMEIVEYDLNHLFPKF